MISRLACYSLVVLILAFSAASNSEEPPRGLDALTVPEGFVVEKVAGSDLIQFAMCMALDDAGRLFVTESSGLDVGGKEMAAEPLCRLVVIEDLNGDGIFDKRTVFAENLSLPMGAQWFGDSLYVASPPHFHRYPDQNRDGVADSNEIVHTGWNVLNTASLHGPFLSPNGWMVLTHGRHGYKIETREGPTLEGMAARIWRCRPDGTGLERFCGGGFDNPVEIVFTPSGEMIGTMTYFTDPKNGQRDALNYWIDGGVYPKPADVIQEFTRTGELLPSITHFARIAPAGLVRFRSASFGPDYEGNLFSAQFNPHRVQRHIIHREGAGFRAEDSDFLVSSDPDFHPTDVEEDADGSLLVIDTGGWYVHACPISRIAKPDITGALYRIRRAGAPHPEDPWGKQIAWDSLPPAELANLLADPRPKVRDRAIEMSVAAGTSAIEPLQAFLWSNHPADLRCQALWALARIDLDALIASVLKQKPAELPAEILIAFGTALSSEPGAPAKVGVVDLSLDILKSTDQPAVKRQFAEVLGKARASRAAEPLILAASGTTDAFLEHAITYALIRIGAPLPPQQYLATSPDPTVRKVSMVALDQMGRGHLDRDLTAEQLETDNENLRRTALWVFSRHAAWAESIGEYLRGKITAPELSEDDAHGVREILLASMANPLIRDLLTEWMTSTDLAPDRRVFAMDIVRSAVVNDFPYEWREALRKALSDKEDTIKWEAVSVIQARGVNGLDNSLHAIVDAATQPESFRMAALACIVARSPEISSSHVALLLSQLAPDIDPTLRLAAAQVLGRSKLGPDDLSRVAREFLPHADGATLPAMLQAFRETSDESIGSQIVRSLLGMESVSTYLKEDQIDAVLAPFPDSVKSAAQPIYAALAKEQAEREQRLLALEPRLDKGDVGRGRQVFYNQTAACYTCHAIGTEGGDLGPDLTTIGAIRSGRDLLEAILFPSASFVPDYEPFLVETLDEIHAGVIAEQSAATVRLRTGADAELRLARSEIVEVRPSTVSIMPAGLDTGMTEQQLIDLLAFLRAQNGNQWLLPEK